MSSSKKHFSLGWAVGIFLGLASSGSVVYAGSIGDTYSTGDTLTATKMTTIKTAVNDNDGKITNLRNNIADGDCGTGMTRVGPTCVDNTRTANGSVSWINAVSVCRTAGKRLLTPGEYMSALNSGSFADMVSATPNQYEWVDAVSSTTQDTTLSGTSLNRMTAGYMGPDDGSNITLNDIFFGTNASYTATFTFIGYRCAR